ncbi:MAG: hypothetical protein ACI9D5_001167 [Candidatus Endobugula sp.]|jgi:hypothetical protein
MNDKLSNDPLFSISFWGGLFLGGFLYLLLILNNDFEFCFELACYNHALDIFSLPISVAAGGMALAAFRATIFRSDQTRAQIEETIIQNKFKNYIDHKKEFVGMLDMLETAHSVKITNRLHLYKNIFPENSPVCMKFDSKELDCEKSWIDFQLDKFNASIKKYNEIGIKICTNYKSPSHKEVSRWLSDYLVLIYKLDLAFPENRLVSNEFKGLFSDCDKFNMIPSDIGNSFYVISEYFKHLASFSLPSRSESINIEGLASVGDRFDERLKVFTRDDA